MCPLFIFVFFIIKDDSRAECPLKTYTHGKRHLQYDGDIKYSPGTKTWSFMDVGGGEVREGGFNDSEVNFVPNVFFEYNAAVY